MSSLIYREIELKRQKSASQFEPRVERFLAKLVRLNGNLKVPNRPGYVYAQQIPEDDAPYPIPVLCVGIQAREGLQVWVERNRDGEWEAVEWSRVIVQQNDYDAQAYLPLHARDHEWPDRSPRPDAVTVYPRALSMLRSYPGVGGALTVDVAPLRYVLDGGMILFPGQIGINLAASQPAAGLARFVGVYLDLATNAIGTVDGATTIDAGPVTPDTPAFPDGVIPSALVRLDGAATVFTEADFVDVRPMIGMASTGGGDLARQVVFEGNVVTHDDEVVYL